MYLHKALYLKLACFIQTVLQLATRTSNKYLIAFNRWVYLLEKYMNNCAWFLGCATHSQHIRKAAFNCCSSLSDFEFITWKKNFWIDKPPIEKKEGSGSVFAVHSRKRIVVFTKAIESFIYLACYYLRSSVSNLSIKGFKSVSFYYNCNVKY